MRELPLLERKVRLQKLLAGGPPDLIYVEHMTGDSARILEHACRMGIEGIVSRRAASPYRSGPVDGLDQDEVRAQRHVRSRRV